MTHDKIIKQLESLLSHCKSMIEKDGGFPIWEKDCEALEAAIAALRPSGEPLTLEQLREMDEQPVWVKCLNSKKYTDPPTGWRIVERSIAGTIGVWNGESCFAERDYGRTWQAYAYPPIDREKWEPCELCGTLNDEIMCKFSQYAAYDQSKTVRYTSAKFCPECGRPLTEEAWAELEKRLRWPAERNERGEVDNLDRLRKLVEADRIERHKIVPLLGKCKVHCLNCGCVLDLMDLEAP